MNILVLSPTLHEGSNFYQGWFGQPANVLDYVCVKGLISSFVSSIVGDLLQKQIIVLHA